MSVCDHILHLTPRRRGRVAAAKWSQLAGHAKLSEDQFVPFLAGRPTRTPVWHRALCRRRNCELNVLWDATSCQMGHPDSKSKLSNQISLFKLIFKQVEERNQAIREAFGEQGCWCFLRWRAWVPVVLSVSTSDTSINFMMITPE